MRSVNAARMLRIFDIFSGNLPPESITRSLIKVVRNAVTPVRLDRILSRGLGDLAVSGLRERQSLLRACRRRKSSACKTGPLGRE